MTERRCDCCDLPESMCGKAIEQRAHDEERARRARALAEPGVVAAAHPGRCPTCSAWFPVGEPIRKVGDTWLPVLCCPPPVSPGHTGV